jgi:hypothetical protein
MNFKAIASVNIILNRIHTAVVDGILKDKEIFENPGIISILFLIYKNNNGFPKTFAVVIHNIRKALLEGKISANEITENLQLLLDELRKKTAAEKSGCKKGNQ